MRRAANQVRIIGGRWRGRRIPFASLPGLRPTGDRTRETLFNWLAPFLPGAACLDLFAGSGALGLEAASRGAREVVLVEQNPLAVRQLREQVQRLEATMVSVVAADAAAFLHGPAREFDIVWLDPPFELDLSAPILARLLADAWLSDDALVYLEHPINAPSPFPPSGFKVWREKTAASVHYALLRRATND